MAHGSQIVSQTTAGASPQSVSVSANQTSGYIVELVIVKSGSSAITVTDSRSGTWVQCVGPTSSPRTEQWKRTAGAALQIGDTITLSYSISMNTCVIGAEFNVVSSNENADHTATGTSATPGDSVTTTTPVTTVVVGFGFASALADTATVTNDSGYTNVNSGLQHAGFSIFAYMAWADFTSAGAKAYAASVVDGLSAPLSKAWAVTMEAMGADAMNGQWMALLGEGV